MSHRPTRSLFAGSKRFWPLAWLVVFGIGQVLIPLRLLLSDQPVRFGWHMYTRVASFEETSFTLIEQSGAQRSLDIHDVFVHGRQEMVVDDAAVLRLCASYPQVVAIRYTMPAQAAREVACF